MIDKSRHFIAAILVRLGATLLIDLAGDQIAVGHLLGQPPDERKYQNPVEGGWQGQGPKRYGWAGVPYTSQPAA
jgi:hypothetical protein